jgi:DNA-binding PadR family transcriptional regulator
VRAQSNKQTVTFLIFVCLALSRAEKTFSRKQSSLQNQFYEPTTPKKKDFLNQQTTKVMAATIALAPALLKVLQCVSDLPNSPDGILMHALKKATSAVATSAASESGIREQLRTLVGLGLIRTQERQSRSVWTITARGKQTLAHNISIIGGSSSASSTLTTTTTATSSSSTLPHQQQQQPRRRGFGVQLSEADRQKRREANRQSVLTYVETNPGCTARTIAERFPQLNISIVYRILEQAQRDSLVQSVRAWIPYKAPVAASSASAAAADDNDEQEEEVNEEGEAEGTIEQD